MDIFSIIRVFFLKSPLAADQPEPTGTNRSDSVLFGSGWRWTDLNQSRINQTVCCLSELWLNRKHLGKQVCTAEMLPRRRSFEASVNDLVLFDSAANQHAARTEAKHFLTDEDKLPSLSSVEEHGAVIYLLPNRRKFWSKVLTRTGSTGSAGPGQRWQHDVVLLESYIWAERQESLTFVLLMLMLRGYSSVVLSAGS